MTVKDFLIGAACGAAAVAILKTPTFRKGCASLIAAGLQLKEDASEYFETLKEDAEDVQAEKKASTKSAQA